jgi:hypothetical protein
MGVLSLTVPRAPDDLTDTFWREVKEPAAVSHLV